MKFLFKIILFSLFITFSLYPVEIKTDHPVVLVIGTRPEAIKVLPLYQALKKSNIPTYLCSTGQHAELLDDVLRIFKVTPDCDFKIMKPNQDLFYVTTSVLERTKELFLKLQPALVVVQGDTTTAMAAAMSAFYLKIPVAHVEAGLRTGNLYAPFPEEFNRRLISVLASYHFAPTKTAEEQLKKEGVNAEKIVYTGNTVVDALHMIIEKLHSGELAPAKPLVSMITEQRAKKRKILLLTAHRRESFNGGLEQIFTAIKDFLNQHQDLFIIYPVHPNPAIKQTLERVGLDKKENIAIISPLQYHEICYVLNEVDGVATDSGGVTEEAVSLKKPVLILRNETDRTEGVKEGQVRVVGTDAEKIKSGIEWIIQSLEEKMLMPESSYGDGKACERIVKIIKDFLAKK